MSFANPKVSTLGVTGCRSNLSHGPVHALRSQLLSYTMNTSFGRDTLRPSRNAFARQSSSSVSLPIPLTTVVRPLHQQFPVDRDMSQEEAGKRSPPTDPVTCLRCFTFRVFSMPVVKTLSEALTILSSDLSQLLYSLSRPSRVSDTSR